VPAGTDAVHAALAEPLSCAVNSVENCGVQNGDHVVVIGAGPMGLLNAWAARAAGAATVWMAEVNELRLRQAEAFGLDRLINSGEEDLRAAIMDATGGIGADVVIVAAPAAAPQEQAPLMVRKRGTVCLFASLPAGNSMLSLDSRPIHYGELRIVGSSDSTPRQVVRAVELLSRDRQTADRMATHRLPLEDILQSFELMQSGEALRVVLEPGNEII
jgi:L-iditol 2-dehydrogenase